MLLILELRIGARFLLDTHNNPQHGTDYCKQHEMHRHGGSFLAFNTVHGKIQTFKAQATSQDHYKTCNTCSTCDSLQG